MIVLDNKLITIYTMKISSGNATQHDRSRFSNRETCSGNQQLVVYDAKQKQLETDDASLQSDDILRTAADLAAFGAASHKRYRTLSAPNHKNGRIPMISQEELRDASYVHRLTCEGIPWIADTNVKNGRKSRARPVVAVIWEARPIYGVRGKELIRYNFLVL